MKTIKNILLVALLFTLTTPPVWSATVDLPPGQSGDERLLRVQIESSDPAGLQAQLQQAGYDILQISSDSVDVAVSPAELAGLQAYGKVRQVEPGRPFQEIQNEAATIDTLEGYRDLQGILAEMNRIAASRPAIAQVVNITTTYGTPPTSQGRNMFALKISDNVALNEDEPAMLIVSTHHAREIVTPEIALEAARRLTSRYGSDSQVTNAVNSQEIWIAPLWNPDGYNHVFTADNLWRKNRRVFPNGVGVDQNRNYPQGWNASCSGSTTVSSSSYKGPAPASEAETQTMISWSQRERFAKVVDFHSTGRETLFAYLCLSHPFTTWMQQEAAAISQAAGYGGATRRPSAEGEEQEWQFAKQGAYAFLIETHTEFQPTFPSALNEAAMVWPAILRVLGRPISIAGHVTDAVTGAPLEAQIELLNVTFSNGESNSSGGPHGRYHLFAPPGTYNVRFSKSGYTSEVRTVTVASNTSSIVLDVQLQPGAATEVFSDNFETEKGWTRNPNGTDTATTGLWERGDPQATTSNGPKQLGTTVSGVNDLVTGRLAGSSAGANDLDGGVTSIQSPAIALPTSGNLTLNFSYYFAHGSNASSNDFLRVKIVGSTTATVFEELGTAVDDDAVWASTSVGLNAFAGQTVRILIEAADGAEASLVEAAVDEVKITR